MHAGPTGKTGRKAVTSALETWQLKRVNSNMLAESAAGSGTISNLEHV